MSEGDEIRLSRSLTIAAVLWGVAGGLFLLMVFKNDWKLAIGAVLIGQVALGATIRHFLVRFSRILKNGFELGRDSVTPLARR